MKLWLKNNPVTRRLIRPALRGLRKLLNPVITLPSRYQTTRFYMKKCGYSFGTAWRRAGIVLS